ncbi:MAG: RNA polymerase sigma factor [Vannielia sp.]|uniref:RNA polymerase sigma factor n=1 Tax=Rhodobacterales TaxID=204455 RepID=UPI002095C67D|nr:RNA polymerase sigma factor [Oceanicola sp. 502str15]MCO6381825.1 RNA polymerase sigma factor [Oceanicola sp. 502str15]
MNSPSDEQNKVDPREEIVEHLPAMRAFAMSLARNSAQADDLVQDSVVKAWSNFDKFKPGTNLRAWLFTILRNTFYSARRKSGREVADVDGVMAGSLASKPDHDGRLALADFQRAFTTLPDEQRETLWLVGALGMSYDEAAETVGCAVGTVKSRANRARARLAEMLHLKEDEKLELTDQSTMAVVAASITPLG